MPELNEITKEREEFKLNDGYYIGNRKIADFEPYVLKKYVTKDLTAGSEMVSYDVKVKDKKGGESEAVRVTDFLKIDYFRDFHQNTAMLTKFEQRTLAFKLQQEALKADLPSEVAVEAAPGYYILNGKPVMVIADEFFGLTGMQETVESICKYKWLPKVEYSNDIIRKYIEFMPGVTEVLFYSALSAIIQPVLIDTGKIPGFVTALIAPSGHLKTTLARIYTQWTSSASELEILFDDRISNDKLSKDIYSAVGLGYLIDDYHKKSREYDKRKYRDRLDTVTRIASENKMAAMIFITAESIEGESIFSEQDRLLDIYIPRMDMELAEYKKKLVTLKREEMSSIAQAFAEAVMRDVQRTKTLICSFIQNYQVPEWVDVTTRLGHHIMIILLTEYLFRMLVCEEHDSISNLSNLEKALEVNGKKQTKELKLLRNKENDRSYILEIFEVLKNRGEDDPDIHITRNSDQYDEDEPGSAYLDPSKKVCYVTSNNLADILRKRMGHVVSIRKVSEELHDLGVLIEDKDKRSVKFRKKRHYLIDYTALKNVCSYLAGDE